MVGIIAGMLERHAIPQLIGNLADLTKGATAAVQQLQPKSDVSAEHTNPSESAASGNTGRIIY